MKRRINSLLYTLSFLGAASIPFLSFSNSTVLAQTSGCGSGETWYLARVATPISAQQFKVACNEHDACYDTPGKLKQECDKAFHNRMLGICARDHNTIFGRPLKIACNGRADAFYSAVVRGGQKAYDDAQRKVAPKFSTIYFKNDCPHPLQVAVHFQDLNNQWQTKAWYAFAPNEKAARLGGVETKNRYIYYYAETTNGANLVWNGNFTFYVKDRLYNMQEINTGPTIVRWTQALTCPQASIPFNNIVLTSKIVKDDYRKIILAQQVKQPVEDQQSPEEKPPIIPKEEQSQVQEDRPKDEVQKSKPGTPPSKGDSDSAQKEPPSPSTEPSPSVSPSPSTEPSPSVEPSSSL